MALKKLQKQAITLELVQNTALKYIQQGTNRRIPTNEAMEMMEANGRQRIPTAMEVDKSKPRLLKCSRT